MSNFGTTFLTHSHVSVTGICRTVARTDNIAWVEIAGLDNDRLEFGGLKNDGLENN